jgi:ATP-dependent DNA helicase RecQ
MPDLDVRFYHAGLNREEREGVEAWFKTSRQGILTATSAYGIV